MTNGTKALIEACISQSQDFKEYNLGELIDIAEKLYGYTKELTDVYIAAHEDATLENCSLAFQQTEGKYKFPDSNLYFDKREFLIFLSIIIDVFEEILPLGSVVDLKKERLKGTLPIDEIENVRIVITHRFLHNPKDKFYFPYAGVVYPVGSMGQERTLHFTSPFIERVVHKGYSDEQDEAFVQMMKHELLCNRQVQSFSFASQNDVLNRKDET